MFAHASSFPIGHPMQPALKIPKVLLLDNHDSFVYNILHEIAVLECECVLWNCDDCTIEDIEALNPTHIVLGPGPGTPTDAGVLMEVVEHFVDRVPMLGICLGHQAIGMHFGGTLTHAPIVQHGKPSVLHHLQRGLFSNIPSPVQVGRYHSLQVTNLPKELNVLATSDDGCVQAVQHQTLPVFGVQFHPESILSQHLHPIWTYFLAQTSPC